MENIPSGNNILALITAQKIQFLDQSDNYGETTEWVNDLPQKCVVASLGSKELNFKEKISTALSASIMIGA